MLLLLLNQYYDFYSVLSQLITKNLAVAVIRVGTAEKQSDKTQH